MEISHFITRFNRGGTARWLNTLIWWGTKHDFNQKLYAGFVEENEIEDPNFLKLKGIHLNGLGRTPNLSQEIKSFFSIRKEIRDSNPDLINTHTSKAGVIGRLAALSLGKNRPVLVHTFHGHVLYGYFGPIQSWLYKKIESGLAKYTDLLISAGDHVKYELIKSKIGNESKFLVINPGVKNLDFISKQSARKRLNISETSLVVGWLGRLEAVKAPERVIEIASEFPEIIFLIGGTGLLLKSLMANAPKNVHFVGWVEPEVFWPACDIALLTSLNEAQPISVIEASKCSLPLVAENVGSVSEVVIHGKTGFLTRNKADRINALRKLIESKTLRIRLGQNAKVFADEKYSVEQFVSQHRFAYNQALQSKLKSHR